MASTLSPFEYTEITSAWIRSNREPLSEEHHLYLRSFFTAYLEGSLFLPLDTTYLTLPLPVRSRWFHEEEGKIFLKSSYALYQRFWKRIHEKASTQTPSYPPPDDPLLLPSQKEAITMALSSSCSVIAGGPGTGKSWTIQHLIRPIPRVVIATPTGKAAANLRISLPHLAITTLHQLLIRAESLITCDLCILEEASMIDLKLFVELLDRIPPSAKLVCVGDPHQLPPIGLGTPFHDLCQSSLPKTLLSHSMRTGNPHILKLSEQILTGEVIPFEPLPSLEKLASWFSPLSLEASIEAHFDFFKQQRILSPVKYGPYGCVSLNQWMEDHNPLRYRPLMVTANDDDQGLYNGDFCLQDPRSSLVYFADGREFPLSALPGYELSYFLSVHKSQGSEFDHVILLIPQKSEYFGKALLYTGATRAKKTLNIYGDAETMALFATSSSLHR